MRSPEVNQPIVFADQKLKKIFVMNSDRTGTVLPENLQLTIKQGNILEVPSNMSSGMTVLDVKGMKAGGYFLNVHSDVSDKTIRIVLF